MAVLCVEYSQDISSANLIILYHTMILCVEVNAFSVLKKSAYHLEITTSIIRNNRFSNDHSFEKVEILNHRGTISPFFNKIPK